MPARVCLGQLPDGAYGLRISKPGIDVLNTDEGGLLFSSGSPFMRIIARGQITWGFFESERVVNLGTYFGYTPLCQMFVCRDPNVTPGANGAFTHSFANVNVRFEGTNAIFSNEYNVGSTTIRYVIYSTRAA